MLKDVMSIWINIIVIMSDTETNINIYMGLPPFNENKTR